MPRKTFILTIIIILASAGAAAILWYLIFGPAPKPLRTGPAISLPAGAPGKKIKQLNKMPAFWATISSSQNKIFWYDQSGLQWSSSFDGSEARASSQAPIQNFIKSIWSPNGSKNIVALGTNQKDIRFVSLDAISSVSTFIRNNAKSVTFSPDSKKIAYQVIDNSQNINTLFSSDPDGKKQKTLSGLKLQDVFIAWPQANLISFTSKPTGLTGGSLWVLNLKTLIFDKLINNLNGLETLWSPDGNKILFSNTDANGQNPKLGVLDLKGNVRDLGISTIVKKCAWASNSQDIYCALPKNWQPGAILPDDYYKNTFSTTDDVGKINTQTGQKNLVASSVIDATNLAVSLNQDFLILITKNDGRLYRFDLK